MSFWRRRSSRTRAEGTPSAAPAQAQPRPPRTRAASTWVALAIGVALLVIVLVFILQNSNEVRVEFLWGHLHLPLGVALLLAAVLGALVALMAGTVRILQLRRHARRVREGVPQQAA
jgi:uncharacterized integral membrane protein